MVRQLNEALTRALHAQPCAATYIMGGAIAEAFPGCAVLETEDCSFDVTLYADKGKCSLMVLDTVRPQVKHKAEYVSAVKSVQVENSLCEVLWRGHRFHTFFLTTSETVRHYLIAETGPLAEEFFSEVCRWCDQVHGEILVFAHGYWRRDEGLVRQIASARFEDLILDPSTMAALLDATEGFFNACETYRRYGIPWKRGVLLTGPPGNGKTHALKALVNRLQKPTFYVRSFIGSQCSEEFGIQAVFTRARNVAPCIVLIEDVDSVVTAKKLSFFLNELDGFAQNEGILVLATTNHPERLDPALVERPSRFDRKVGFGLPEPSLRSAYLDRQTRLWSEGFQPDGATIGRLAEATEGFSFAYLKELCLSSLMAWVSADGAVPMEEVLDAQVEALRKQVAAGTPAIPEHVRDDDDD
ncbi:MAG: ATP-binding protein [Armatimonadetes bacterium]|nr:ATP-binding protein [Armatimonadota bacterium]